MHFCAEAGGLDHKASWALGCCGRGVAELFWIWRVLGAVLQEWAWQGGVGAPLNDSLALSRNAEETEGGVGGNREDTEDTGALCWGRETGFLSEF